jgi:hypothetical protein
MLSPILNQLLKSFSNLQVECFYADLKYASEMQTKTQAIFIVVIWI